jgi:hypothetical protein
VPVRARDDVHVDHLADGGEEVGDLLLLGVVGQAPDEDGTAVMVVLLHEHVVRVGARHEGLLLDVEGVNAEAVMLADRLWEMVSMEGTRLSMGAEWVEAYRVEIPLGIKLGELDQDRHGEAHGLLHLDGEDLTLGELPVGLQDLPGGPGRDVFAVAAVDDEGA